MRLVWIALLALTACTVEQKEELAEESLDDPERRTEMTEAVLRVMDENPEYVDEFFRLARRHPDTFDRVLDELSCHTLCELRIGEMARGDGGWSIAVPEDDVREVLR